MNALHTQYDHVSVEPCHPGGTLGLFYDVRIDGMPKFVKTHSPGKAQRLNLEKEIMILEVLYGEDLRVQRLQTTSAGEEFVFLVMDRLDVSRSLPTYSEVRSLTQEYSDRLNGRFPSEHSLHSLYSLEQVCDEASKATESLLAHGHLSEDIAMECLQQINLVRQSEYVLSLCHGDLSNKNIMVQGKRLYVIDWEDAFWAPSSYDLYYWLTFFDQRRYYEPEKLLGYGVDLVECVSFMTTITVIKCYLGYLTGGFHTQSLSFNQRLFEVLDLNK